MNANLTAANSSISSLQSNAATQASLIDTLTSNAAVQSANLAQLSANAIQQGEYITSIFDIFTLGNLEFGNINSNVANNTSNLTSVWSLITLSNSAFANTANVYQNTIFNSNVSANNLISGDNLISNRDGVLNGNLYVNGNIQIGLPPNSDYPGKAAIFTNSIDGYYQIIIQNLDSGSNSSSDISIIADDGDDENYYLNLGINSSTYQNTFQDSGIEEFAHDGYFRVIGGNAAIRTTANIIFSANTAVVALGQDGDLFLINANLRFADGTVQNTAVEDPVGLLSNVSVIQTELILINANTLAANTEINSLRANITVANIAIDNSAAEINSLRSNITAANVSIASSVSDIDSLRANIQAANVAIANVTANVNYTMANYQNWTSNVTSISSALDQLAERLKLAGF